MHQNDTRTSLVVHPTVQRALDDGKPVVALESTIIAHGMPYPQNFTTAKQLEQTVLKNGAIPATIAVLKGRPCIGLTEDELLHLATAGTTIKKLALRDLPMAYAEKRDGATTVSATMHLAHRAGIRVFATGGIGGVHRGVAQTWDISADVPALSRFPVLVVCAGAKAILDIRKTLEALETASVPVFVLKSNTFPAFYTRDSGEMAPIRVDSPLVAATAFHAAINTGLSTGALLAVPLPTHHEPDATAVQAAINIALDNLNAAGDISPAQVTPFLLRRVSEITRGTSLTANMRLAEHNAAVAAQTAVHLAQLFGHVSTVAQTHADILVIGAAVLDTRATPSSKSVAPRATNVGHVSMRPGGVAFNVALAAHRLTTARVRFLSVIADDESGRTLAGLLDAVSLKEGKTLDIQTPIARERRGAVVVIVHDKSGDMLTGVADTDGLFAQSDNPLYPIWGPKLEAVMNGVRMVIIDANLGIEDIRRIVEMARMNNIEIWLEPTSVAKCVRFVQADVLADARYISPNVAEALALAKAVSQKQQSAKTSTGFTNVDEIESAIQEIVRSKRVAKQTIFLTKGEKGVSRFVAHANTLIRKEFEATTLSPQDIVSTTGAGDCFVGRCAAGVVLGETEDVAIRNATIAAAATCMTDECVPASSTVNALGARGRARL